MKTIYLLALSCVLFAACNDEDGDTTKPVINLIAPANGDTLHIGEGVHLDMELEDDVMLKQYRINIHPNNDGHTHTHAAVLSRAEPDTTVYLDQSWLSDDAVLSDDISGNKNKDVHHHKIVIPANTKPGKYHFMVYCTDAAGNESLATRNIVLATEEDEGEPGHGHDH